MIYKSESLEDLFIQVATLQLSGATFKVNYVKNSGQAKSEHAGFENRRAIERELGLHINGIADLRQPDRYLGS